MRFPYLIKIIFLGLFSMNCVHLQFLVRDNPISVESDEIVALESIEPEPETLSISNKLLEEKD